MKTSVVGGFERSFQAECSARPWTQSLLGKQRTPLKLLWGEQSWTHEH